jgi:hypothetical protein
MYLAHTTISAAKCAISSNELLDAKECIVIVIIIIIIFSNNELVLVSVFHV